ncbi:hypothetical protein, partial [Mesorhizobium sp.]|uniref:hypothetical protein n=1 Tax=Mesorhizobium sp. TaxID=1871066 RepID=UPI0025C1818D
MVQNSVPLHFTVKVAEWILGSTRVASLLAPPVDDEVMGVCANRQRTLPTNANGPPKAARTYV